MQTFDLKIVSSSPSLCNCLVNNVEFISPLLPPRRELEILEGWGVQKPRKFQRGGEVDGQIKFQMVQSDSVPTYSCSC